MAAADLLAHVTAVETLGSMRQHRSRSGLDDVMMAGTVAAGTEVLAQVMAVIRGLVGNAVRRGKG